MYNAFLFIDNTYQERWPYNFLEFIEKNFNDTEIFYITNKKNVEQVRKTTWGNKKNGYNILPMELFGEETVKNFMNYFDFYDIFYMFKKDGEYVYTEIYYNNGNVSYFNEMDKNIKTI